MLPTGLFWLGAVVALIITVAVLIARSARPSTSVAKVLYDVENPGKAQ
ncbi:MAG TPA: hypothetical protein VK886_16875 [Vicinamibacterales bacterium]|nr:hypothetical protein [Vicinamibacterales bacterium]